MSTTENIPYGEFEVPQTTYKRAMLSITITDEGHWLWTGAHSGKRLIPQIGSIVFIRGSKGTRRLSKILSVSRLLFIYHNEYIPYQIRKDRGKCKEKLCVNPAHYYAIPSKPEPRRKGNRRNRVTRIPGEVINP